MQKKSIHDIGEEVKLLMADDVLKILKELSFGTLIQRIPQSFVDLLNGNYDSALTSVTYVPNIYFLLKSSFRKDKKIIRATLNSYKKHFEKLNVM